MSIDKKQLHKILLAVLLAVLAFGVFYLGTSCGMTMRKVLTQPHLEGAGSNYSFLGFLFLSIANGVGAILSAAAAAVIIVLYRKKQKK